MQVLDRELDLRTVKYSIWKSSGDVRLYYREVEPPSTVAGEEKITDKADLAKREDKDGGSSDDKNDKPSEKTETAQPKEENTSNETVPEEMEKEGTKNGLEVGKDGESGREHDDRTEEKSSII